MKKVLYSFAVVAMLLMAMPSTAQVQFGLRAGVNLTNFKLSGDLSQNFDKSNQAGFFVGPTVKFTLPIVGLGVDASALYDHRAVKFGDENVKYQAITIPVNLRYGVGLGSVADVFVFAGPQVGFNVSKKYQDWSWKTADFSINAGIGFMFIGHLEVKANYNFACTKSSYIIDQVTGNQEAADTKFNTWQIGLAYWF